MPRNYFGYKNELDIKIECEIIITNHNKFTWLYVLLLWVHIIEWNVW